MFPPFSMTPLFAFVARSIFVIYFLFVSSCDCSLKRFIVIFFSYLCFMANYLFTFFGQSRKDRDSTSRVDFSPFFWCLLILARLMKLSRNGLKDGQDKGYDCRETVRS